MEDLQSLLEKINREGVEKAEAKAKEILDEAKAKADALLKAARDEAAGAKAAAEADAADYVRRAEETIAQAARDTVLGVESAVTKKLERLLAADVDKALADEAAVTALVKETVAEFSSTGEIVAGEKLAKTLAAQLAAEGRFTVVTDENAGSGFSVKLDGGRVEHSFTGEVVSAELAKRLRPELAKLVK